MKTCYTYYLVDCSSIILRDGVGFVSLSLQSSHTSGLGLHVPSKTKLTYKTGTLKAKGISYIADEMQNSIATLENSWHMSKQMDTHVHFC